MSTLHIHLLGTFRLYQDLSLKEIRVIPNVQTLLTLLLVQRGRLYSRDKIASLLWDEASEEQAHSCLNTTLWRLRKILEPSGVAAGSYLISTPNGELGFNMTVDCWVDMIEFEKKAQHMTNITCGSASLNDIQQLEQAVSMYNGDLLEGCYYDWLLRERERLNLAYIEALYYLLSFYQYHKEYAKAIHWGQQILLVDPLREDVHRDLMRLYTENGQRALAVRQYHCCQKILKTDLGINPMIETQKVYETILGNQNKEAFFVQDRVSLGETLRHVRDAMECIYQAQQDLKEALSRLER